MSKQGQQTSDGGKKSDRLFLDPKIALLAVCAAIGVGVAVTLFFAAQTSTFASFASVAAFGLAVASASLLVGSIRGNAR